MEQAQPYLAEVSDRVFAYVQPDGGWFLNNAGFVLAGRDTVGIDTCSTERRTRAYLEAITATGAPTVRALVNTHHHGDHTNGNHLFDSAIVVAHEHTRARALATAGRTYEGVEGVDWGDVRCSPAALTFRDAITLHAGEVRAEVRYIGAPAHTTNDSVVWLPDQRVLFAGDLVFNGTTPFALMGSVSGSIRALEAIRALDAETIVPGHGPVCGREAVDACLGYFHFLQRTAHDGHTQGTSALELARATDLGPYGEWGQSERFAANLHRAYAELDHTPPGAPIDQRAAIRDMIAYHGGPLSTHHV